MDIRFRVPSSASREETAALVKHTLEGLALGYVARHIRLGIPDLYQSGVRFAADPDYGSGVERFAAPEESLARGWVDCDGAVLWRLCDLLRAGRAAGVRCWYDDDHGDMHVVVRHGSGGDLEDPAHYLEVVE